MTTNDPPEDAEPVTRAPLDAAPTREMQESQPAGSALPRWRWIAAAVLVLVLLIYAVTRRSTDRNATPANTATPTATALPDLLTMSLRYYQAKRYPEAIAAAKAILAQDPNSADAYNNLGVSYAALGQWDEAAKSLENAIRLRPDYQLAKNNLVWVTQEKQKQTPPQGTPEYYLNQSLAEFRANRFQESAAAAQAALQLRPEYPEAYNNLAVAQIGLHRYDDAIAAAQNALRLKPDFQLAKNNLVWALTEKQTSMAGKARSK